MTFSKYNTSHVTYRGDIYAAAEKKTKQRNVFAVGLVIHILVHQ